VHISMLANKFVKDAREIVKAGDVVKVKVLEVDLARKRIALTMRLDDAPRPRNDAPRDRPANAPRPAQSQRQPQRPAAPEPIGAGAMAEALAAALKRRGES